MQIVPTLAAASTSPPATPGAQATTEADAFGQLLLALLTGPVASEQVVPQLAVADDPAEDVTRPEPAKKDAETDDPTALAGVAAMLQLVQAAPQAALAAEAQPEAAAAEGEAAEAVQTTAAPVVAPQGVTGNTAGLVAVADGDTEQPQLAAEPQVIETIEVAAPSLPRRLPTANAEAKAAGVVAAPVTDEAQSSESADPWVPVLPADAEAEGGTVAAATTDAQQQPGAEGEGKGEAYARVAAAKRFASSPAIENVAGNPAASLQRGEAAPVHHAEGEIANGVRPAELIDRVAGQIRVTAEAGGGEARIQLQPESLGRIDISVKVEGGQVNVSLSADSPAVQHAITTRLPDLVQALTAGGMTVAQANVDVSDQSRQQHQGWAQQAQLVAGPAEDDAASGSSAVDWLQPMSIVNLSA